MGSWVTGEKFARFARWIISKRGYPASVISPGSNLDEVLEIIQNLHSYYDQILIAGYPPFLKSIIDEGGKKALDWKKIKVHLLSGGEGFSENWREYIAQKLGNQTKNFSAYGSADAGIGGGHETPLSVFVRQCAWKNRDLAKDLFGNADVLPMVFQYNPTSHFIEEINNELVFTTLSGLPIVRYNLHDHGGVRPFQTVVEILEKHGCDYKKNLQESGWALSDIAKLPFSFVFGRSDGTIILSGANIYVENIKHILHLPDFVSKMTGNFIAEKISDSNLNTRLKLTIQVKNDVLIDENFKNQYKKIIVDELMKVNSEYQYLYGNYHEAVVPIIDFVYKILETEKQIKNKYIV